MQRRAVDPSIDDKISARIGNASVSFGKLTKRLLVRFAMSPKRVWRDFCVQIELGVEIANLGGE